MTEQEHVEETMRQIHLLLAQSQQMKGMEGHIIVDRERLFELLEEINRCMYSMMDSYEISKQAHATAVKRTQRKCEQMIKKSEKAADDVYAASLIYMEDAMKNLFRRIQGFQKEMDKASQAFSQEMEGRLDAVEANHKDLHRQLKDIMDEETYLKAVELAHKELGIEEKEEEIEEVKTPYRPLKRPRRWGEKPGESAKPVVSVKVNSGYDEESLITPKEEKKAEELKVTIDKDAVYFVHKELEAEEAARIEEQEKAEAQKAQEAEKAAAEESRARADAKSEEQKKPE